ncbi:hypothetical protein EVAR_100740_1 [Eumeta japonica]|uniref:Uncharacterized protein n=1 Tax=Eumeta variegata TaxID=151549 RepID=A0A4C1ZVX7_EUMVA|nr:hypothetical protein EVAR_100740_1 [Eumeta japonica]
MVVRSFSYYDFIVRLDSAQYRALANEDYNGYDCRWNLTVGAGGRCSDPVISAERPYISAIEPDTGVTVLAITNKPTIF